MVSVITHVATVATHLSYGYKPARNSEIIMLFLYSPMIMPRWDAHS